MNCSFEINENNVRDLACLSDKYMIEALRRDIRVHVFKFFKHSSKQNYVLKLIVRKDPPTYDLWQFAATYSLDELEQYCRADSIVQTEIHSILGDRGKGAKFLLNSRIPLTLVNELVSDYITELRADLDNLKARAHGQEIHDTIECDGCRAKPI